MIKSMSHNGSRNKMIYIDESMTEIDKQIDIEFCLEKQKKKKSKKNKWITNRWEFCLENDIEYYKTNIEIKIAINQ